MADTFVGELLPFIAGEDGVGGLEAALESYLASADSPTGISGDGDCTLELFSLVAGDGNPRETEAFTLVATGACGEIGEADLALEAFQLDATDGWGGFARLEMFTIEATGATGYAATVDVDLPAFTLSAVGLHDDEGVVDSELLAFQLAAQGDGHTVGEGAMAVRRFTLSATGENGGVGTAAIELPLYEMDDTGAGYENPIGTALILLPLFDLAAKGYSDAAAPTTAIVVNTRTRAVSTYAGLAFNSLTQFQGVLLAANADGVVALTGEDDDGVPIASYLEGGKLAFGGNVLSTVISAYVNYRTTGTLRLTLTVDEDKSYQYDLEPRQYPGILHPSRVKCGRGAEGLNWQWRLDALDGARFQINRFQPHVELTTQGL